MDWVYFKKNLINRFEIETEDLLKSAKKILKNYIVTHKSMQIYVKQFIRNSVIFNFQQDVVFFVRRSFWFNQIY